MKKFDNNFTNFISLAMQSMYYLVNEKKPSHNLRLCRMKYSKKHGHDICITQVIGKSIYPEFAADEIISNPKLLREFLPEDVVAITKIAMHIEYLKKNSSYTVCEIHLKESKNEICIIQEAGSEHYRSIDISTIAHEQTLLEKFSSVDAYNFGYENGVKDMRNLTLEMQTAKKQASKGKNLLNKIRKFFIVENNSS